MANELTEKPNIELYVFQHSDVLETIVDDAVHRYLGIKDVKRFLDFGKVPRGKQLWDLTDEVVDVVNNYLDIKPTRKPHFRYHDIPHNISRGVLFGLVAGIGMYGQGAYFSTPNLEASALLFAFFALGIPLSAFREGLIPHYDDKNKQIILGERRFASAVGLIAHEYAHHLQDVYTNLIGQQNPIVEGHATSIERKISEQYAITTGNPAFVFESSEAQATLLLDAYLDNCVRNKLVPNKNIPVKGVPRISHYAFGRKVHSILCGHHYCLGTAAMRIAEALHGEDVYRKVLQNDFSFLTV